MPTLDSLHDGYQALWDSMTVTRPTAVNSAARVIIANQNRYKDIETTTGVPWYLIGALHMRECDNNFRGCLHDGEMIIGTNRRTRQVPTGRGPFATFEDSAVDALKIEGMLNITDWDIPTCLYYGEKYNGWGYRGHGNSPYVWAGSNHYTSGKYVRDGVYSSSTVDPQLGIAPVMKAVLDITGATSVPGSRGQVVTSWGKWLLPAGGGFTAVMDQFGHFLTDWKTIAAMSTVMVGGGLVFAYLEYDKLRAYKDARYIPSGEVFDVEPK